MAKNILGFIRDIFQRDNQKVPVSSDTPNVVHDSMYNQNASLGSMLSIGNADMFGNKYSPNGHYNTNDDLLSRYADYENMDDFGELSNALDIMADEACQEDYTTKKIINVVASDRVIEEELKYCFDKNILADDHAWEICRTMLKYGSDFEEHIVTEHDGLIGIKFLPPPHVRRIEDQLGTLLGFVADASGQFRIDTNEFRARLKDKRHNTNEFIKSNYLTKVLEDWEVTHFRLRSRHRDAIYGYGMLDASRHIMKRLMLLEDAALLYKITRAPQRFAYNIDVGDIAPNEVQKYLQDVKNALKKQKVLDPATGKLDIMAGLMNSQEDVFIPVRKDRPSMSVDTIGGFDASFYMDDLQYFKDKLYATVKVPKDYLNYTEDSVSKANLSTLDIRISRTTLRVQKEVKRGYKNMAKIHLAAIGYDPDMVDYDIEMAAPSSIFEQTLLEVKKVQLEVADQYKAFVDDYWILKNILKFSDSDITEMHQRKREQGDGAFSESRFPNIESRQMNPEVKKMMDDMGKHALENDKKMGARIKALQGLAEDLKSTLKRR